MRIDGDGVSEAARRAEELNAKAGERASERRNGGEKDDG
jgi:hypothetical protein